MFDPLDEAERKANTEKMQREGFAQFKADPLTRVTLSKIPAGEESDTLEMLLRAAYDAGFNKGSADVLICMLKTAFTKKPGER